MSAFHGQLQRRQMASCEIGFKQNYSKTRCISCISISHTTSHVAGKQVALESSIVFYKTLIDVRISFAMGNMYLHSTMLPETQPEFCRNTDIVLVLTLGLLAFLESRLESWSGEATQARGFQQLPRGQPVARCKPRRQPVPVIRWLAP